MEKMTEMKENTPSDIKGVFPNLTQLYHHAASSPHASPAMPSSRRAPFKVVVLFNFNAKAKLYASSASSASSTPLLKLNLKRLGLGVSNIVCHVTTSYPHCNIELRDPPAYVRVFEDGRINIIGARSEFDARIAARKIARKVQKNGHRHLRGIQDFQFYQIMGIVRLQFRVRVNGEEGMCLISDPDLEDDCDLLEHVQGGCSYTPAPVYGVSSINIHSSGFMRMNGILCRKKCYGCLRALYPYLLKHRVKRRTRHA